MIRDDLAAALSSALAALGVDPPAEIVLERPARREHGDWSSNVALATAKASGRNPRQLASEIAERLNAALPAHVSAVEVAGPGFVNFRLHGTWLHEVLREVVAAGPDGYARHGFGAGERVMIEFVSANPTGPIHVGNGWYASYGDAVGRLLSRCGYDVSREYYINDTGGQIRRLGASVLARRRGAKVPEGGYPSGFVKGLGSAYEGSEDETEAGRWAAACSLRYIRTQMEAIHIYYDEWISQASIEESSAMEETMAILQDKGLVYEEDGALWLRTEAYGDPREQRVVRKGNGDWTYLVGDLAYHRDKFMIRGFDRVINVWGADHAGQVSSLLAGVEALGVEKGRLEVRIGQMISLASGRIGKRLGNAVDLDDLVEEIGPDAMRLLSLVSSPDQGATIDLDKVRADSKESPVYYVQYAHARIASINRVAGDRGVVRVPIEKADLSLLTHEREFELIGALFELPDVVRFACEERAPHKVTSWVRELADRFHGFYHDCYVMGDGVSAELTQARLWLVEASRIGFSIGLDLLGVSAPEAM